MTILLTQLQQVHNICKKELQDNSKYVTNGSFNKIYKKKFPNVKCRQQFFDKQSSSKKSTKSNSSNSPKSSAIRMAVSMPLSKLNSEESKQQHRESAENIEQLYRYNINSPFIQTLVYYDQQQVKVAQLANHDLHESLESETQTRTQDQNNQIAAQLILAVHTLHKANLVHRDIKPQNILVYANDHIQLADLDTITPVDAQGKSTSKNAPSLIGTPTYSAPETAKCIKRLKNIRNLNLKAMDIYATAITLLDIYKIPREKFYHSKKRHYIPIDKRIDLIQKTIPDKAIANHLKDLIEAMTSSDPNKRINIDDVMNHEFFTSMASSKHGIFKDVEKKHRHDTYYDGYYQSKTSKPDDSFFILPGDIKTIDTSVRELENKVNLLITFNNKFKTKPNQPYVAEDIIIIRTVVMKAIDNTLQQIKKITENNNLKSYHNPIKKLKLYINGIKNQFFPTVPDIIQTNLTAETLANTVENAVNEYISINKLDQQIFSLSFSFSGIKLHTQKGAQRANKLLAAVKSLSKVESSSKVKTINENAKQSQIATMYAIIQQTLKEKNTGNSNQSFNIILQKKLDNLFPKTYYDKDDSYCLGNEPYMSIIHPRIMG